MALVSGLKGNIIIGLNQMRTENQTTIDALKTDNSPIKNNQVEVVQKVFRNVCIVLLLVLVFCVPGFIKFREYCVGKGYHVFSADSFAWCGLGFFLVFVSCD